MTTARLVILARLAGGLAASMALTLLLYGQSLQGWWCCDDPALLRHARDFAPWEIFFRPEAYRTLLPYSLQPLLTLSFGVDLKLFGLQPWGFFLHQLAVIALCSWLLQRIAALWLREGLAQYAATVVFLVGSPVAMASQYLMTRHYLEGLLFFLLGFWLLLRQMMGGPDWLRWPASIALALAVSAKEVFVPLGLLPFLVPVGTPAQRLRTAWPWLLVLMGYVAWRRHMLGEFLGGYLPGGTLNTITPQAVVAAATDAASVLGPWPLPMALGLAVLAIAALSSQGTWRRQLWLVGLAGVLGGPLLPLVAWPGFEPGSRYLLIPWAAMAVMTALALGRVQTACATSLRWVAWLLITTLAVSVCWQSRQLLEANAPYLAKNRRVGEFFLSGAEEDAAFTAGDLAGWFVRGLVALRHDAASQPVATPYLDPGIAAGPPAAMRPTPLADESDLAGLPPPPAGPRRIYGYDPATQTLKDVTGERAARLQAWRRSLSAQPLAVEVAFRAQERALFLHLEGPPGAAYYLLSGGTLLNVPAQFGVRMDRAPQGCFRVRADLSGGQRIYSPPLRLPPLQGSSSDQIVRWKGPGDLFDGTAPACASAAAEERQ